MTGYSLSTQLSVLPSSFQTDESLTLSTRLLEPALDLPGTCLLLPVPLQVHLLATGPCPCLGMAPNLGIGLGPEDHAPFSKRVTSDRTS